MLNAQLVHDYPLICERMLKLIQLLHECAESSPEPSLHRLSLLWADLCCGSAVSRCFCCPRLEAVVAGAAYLRGRRLRALVYQVPEKVLHAQLQRPLFLPPDSRMELALPLTMALSLGPGGV